MKTNLKLSSTACLLLLCTAFCSTQLSAESIAQSLQHCREQSDDVARLRCYDKLSTAAQGKPVADAAALQVIQDESPQPALVDEDSAAQAHSPSSTSDLAKYGLTEKKSVAEEEPTITAKVLKVERDAFKKLIITLDIGHVWLQKETGFFKLEVGDEVYLQSGALGSYFLGKPGMNKRIRVKRLR